MNLGFSTVFPGDKKGIGGKPTHFVLKILKGIDSWKGYNYLKKYSLVKKQTSTRIQAIIFRLRTYSFIVSLCRIKRRSKKTRQIHFPVCLKKTLNFLSIFDGKEINQNILL